MVEDNELGQLFAEAREAALDATPKDVKVYDSLCEVDRMLARLQEKKDRLVAYLKRRMGECNTVVNPESGDVLVRWSNVKDSEVIDTARLKAEAPEVFERFKKIRKGSRRFQPVKPKEDEGND